MLACSVTSHVRLSPGSSVHGILQARILEWVAMPSSRESSRSRDWTCVSCSSCIVGGWILYHWATKEAHTMTVQLPNSWNKVNTILTCSLRSNFISCTNYILCSNFLPILVIIVAASFKGNRNKSWSSSHRKVVLKKKAGTSEIDHEMSPEVFLMDLYISGSPLCWWGKLALGCWQKWERWHERQSSSQRTL